MRKVSFRDIKKYICLEQQDLEQMLNILIKLLIQ